MFSRLLNSKTKTVTFSAFLLAVFSLLSGFLGLIRNNLLGHLFQKSQADAYLAAFRIPDFVYGILITGGIVAAFLPVFSLSAKKSRQDAEKLTNNVLTIFFSALVFISLILAIFTPQLATKIVPGFSSEQKEITVSLTRLMFLSPIILGISSIFSALLQYHNLFFALAVAPLFYNVGIIIGILFLSPLFGLNGLAFGVILGAVLHFFTQFLPVLKTGFRFRPNFNLKDQGLRKIFRLMIPRVFGSGAYHINLIVITAIASTLEAGSIRVFSFSNDLYNVPLGLIGISFATAAFPVLSRNFAGDEKNNFFKNFSSAFSKIIFLIIPLSALIFILRAQIVRLLYGTRLLFNGYFDWQDTRLIAASLGIFSFSIFAASLIPLLARSFFAIQDTKTPVKIAVFSIGLNIALCFLFVHFLGFSNVLKDGLTDTLHLKGMNISVLGLPLAVSISTTFQFFWLYFVLKQKIAVLNFKLIFKSFKKIFVSTLLMSFFVYFVLWLSSFIFNTRTVIGLLLQSTAAALTGCVAYFVSTYIFKLEMPRMILFSIRHYFNKKESEKGA